MSTATVAPPLRVLVVDDDEWACQIATDALCAAGLYVLEARDGATALAMINDRDVDAVVLDLGLPDMSGFDVLARLRAFSDLPVLILSGRTEQRDLIQGLELGADDYMAKPCSPGELAARVAALLRRARTVARSATLDFGAMFIDVGAHELAIDGDSVELTPLEFELLVYLARSPRTVVSRKELLETVWHSSMDWQTPATVTEHVRRLRAKIERAPEKPRWVVTVRGLGYRFEPE
jgi:DNA-binding response OmpR family regulator